MISREELTAFTEKSIGCIKIAAFKTVKILDVFGSQIVTRIEVASLKRQLNKKYIMLGKKVSDDSALEAKVEDEQIRTLIGDIRFLKDEIQKRSNKI